MGSLLRLAAGTFHLPKSLIASVGGGRILPRHLGKGAAGLLLLAELVQRHAELEKRVGCARALWKGLEARQETACRVLVLALNVVGLAQPILSIAGKLMVAIARQEQAESGFRLAELPIGILIISAFIDLLGRAAGAARLIAVECCGLHAIGVTAWCRPANGADAGRRAGHAAIDGIGGYLAQHLGSGGALARPRILAVKLDHLVATTLPRLGLALWRRLLRSAATLPLGVPV